MPPVISQKWRESKRKKIFFFKFQEKSKWKTTIFDQLYFALVLKLFKMQTCVFFKVGQKEQGDLVFYKKFESCQT